MSESGGRLRWLRAAWAPAVVVFVALGALLGVYLAVGGDPRDFLHIEPYYLIHGAGASPYLRYDPRFHGYAPPNAGYDGQFYYYIAVDPAHAAIYLDNPAYRFSRPLYPFLARLLALGQPDLIPWTMLLINWLAISGTVLALGAILRKRGAAPWLALLYAAFPGILLALYADVTEPLAYGLVALGLWLYERGGKRMWLWVGLAFALAALARETTAVFALALALAAAIREGRAAWAVARGRGGAWRAWVARVAGRPALWLAGVLAPYAVWKALTVVWFGSNGVPATLTPAWLPFQGLAQLWPWSLIIWSSALFVALPGALCLALGFWGLWRRPDASEFWALTLQALFFCALLRSGEWDLVGAYRLSIGAPLALLWALPALIRLGRRAGVWMTGLFAIWDSLAPLVALTFFPAINWLLNTR